MSLFQYLILLYSSWIPSVWEIAHHICKQLFTTRSSDVISAMWVVTNDKWAAVARDAGTLVGQGCRKKVEGNGNLWKTKKNRYQLCLLLFNKNDDLKNNKRSSRKFVSTRSWQTIKLPMMFLWKRHFCPRPVVPLLEGQGQCHRSPPSLPTAISSHCLPGLLDTCPDVCVQPVITTKYIVINGSTVTCGKTPIL